MLRASQAFQSQLFSKKQMLPRTVGASRRHDKVLMDTLKGCPSLLPLPTPTPAPKGLNPLWEVEQSPAPTPCHGSFGAQDQSPPKTISKGPTEQWCPSPALWMSSIHSFRSGCWRQRLCHSSLHDPEQYILSQEYSLIAPFLSGQSLNYTLIAKKSAKQSQTAHNKGYRYMRVLEERVQFAPAAIWTAFCSSVADWWLLCLFQGTYVTEQILPRNLSAEPTQICTHAHKCVSCYRCFHAYLPSERSEHHPRAHTHTQSKLENLLAGILWIPKNMERNRQLCCDPKGPSVSGNVNLPCLHRFWWLREQPVQLWLKLAATKNKLVLYQFATFQQTEQTTSHTTWPISHMLFKHIMFEREKKIKFLLGLSL